MKLVKRVSNIAFYLKHYLYETDFHHFIDTSYYWKIMAQNSILFSSATDIAEKIKTQELTSFEVVSAFINQIEHQNSTYNAIVLLNKTNALEKAKQADLATARANPGENFMGYPLQLKTITEQKD
jgi:Asp-tRNA(Asn)/Glu-tRNA(Gln) amidotransferase A subunit family amidase